MNSASREPLRNLSCGKPADAGDFILSRRHRLAAPHLPEGGVLLDYGCGNGAQTFLFADRFSRVIGVDVVPESIAQFEAEVASRGAGERIQPVLYAGDRLPLESASIDGVISFEVLEHVASESESLDELRRVVRPGGRVVMSVPNRWWIFETHGADLPLLPWNRVPFFSWLPTRLHDRWARARIYRRRHIVRLLEEHGFAVLRSAYITAPMDVIGWAPLRDALRATVFRPDTTRLPLLATAVLVVGERRP